MATHIAVTVTTLIAFGDIQGVARQPVIGVLNAMASEVERICAAIEAEAQRLGLTT
jgi:hypothetical protein